MSDIFVGYIIPVIHVLACLFLIVVVLLQTGKGADMGAVFGGGSQTLFGSGAGALRSAGAGSRSSSVDVGGRVDAYVRMSDVSMNAIAVPVVSFVRKFPAPLDPNSV